ncbi:MAG: hypothetical protein JW863_08825 [Chitinispirillaceae bacterium]|nr:hypothetical protein [Chitinispirillaceae bacterium]
MKLQTFILSALWIITGTVLFLNGYYYESGTTCFWLVIATLCWPSFQRQTNGKAWRMFGWFHLHLIPIFLIAHVIGSRFGFWLYEGTYLFVIPPDIPLIGAIPLFEFIFYSVFTAAVLGIYFMMETLVGAGHTPERNLLIIRTATLVQWAGTILLLIFKPNVLRTQWPYWFFLMAGSSIPFSCAILGVPPFAGWMPFVADACKKNAFAAFCLLLFPLMLFWELSAVQQGLWVYNPSIMPSFIINLSPDGARQWPLDQLFGHTNTAIFVFLATLYRKMTDAAGATNI